MTSPSARDQANVARVFDTTPRNTTPRNATSLHAVSDDPETVRAEIERLRAEVENLKAALSSNRDIGAATGVLMVNHRLTQQQAFEVLRLSSQHTHRKLRELATDVLFTGALPEECTALVDTVLTAPGAAMYAVASDGQQAPLPRRERGSVG